MSPSKAKKANTRLVEPEVRVRQYELTFLLPTTADAVKIGKSMEATVKKQGGSVISQEDWGKKQLAYTIKHSGERYSQANYFHWILEMPADKLKAFDKQLVLNATLLRYLLVLAEEIPAVEIVEETEKKA